jgi:hypothetical protein
VCKKKHTKETEESFTFIASSHQHGETTTTATVAAAKKDRDRRDHEKVGREEFGGKE